MQGPRRSTRSTGDKKEEWIKIPVEASVSVEGSDLRTLEGLVFLSSETLRKCLVVVLLLRLGLCVSNQPTINFFSQTELYKRSGLAYFETWVDGACYNYLVPEEQLPMLTSK